MAAVLLVGLVLIWFGRVPPKSSVHTGVTVAPRAGAVAPSFELTNLEGTPVSLEALRGRPVVINFWATWCLPCRSEMPALQRVWENYQDDGLVILAINLQESSEQVASFAQELNLSFPILLDHNGRLFQTYNVQLYPTTFFVAGNGIIQEVVYGGPMAETLIASQVSELLALDTVERD